MIPLLANESDLDSLSESLQQQLAEVLERYLIDLESGVAGDPEQLIREHPKLAPLLRRYLESLDLICKTTAEVAPPRTQPLLLGETSQLGDYRIEKEIGRGGMGIVYEATQISLGRKVALKVLPFAALLDQTQITRFRNEAQSAASLHHPHIVPVFAVGCERGVHYYSMQLIDGQSLDEIIEAMRDRQRDAVAIDQATDADSVLLARRSGSTQGRASALLTTAVSIHNARYVRHAVELAIQAALALHHAHENGIVHRDVKPSNLMLDATGKLWVTDFGLARCQTNSKLTVSGDILGTARYMSPEQSAGRAHEVDHRTDVYSLGVTLYELLTLRPAYDATDRLQLLTAIETQAPLAPRKLNRTIPADLEIILSKGFAKDRIDRYLSAEDFAADLQRFLDGKPTYARRPSLLDRTMKWCQQRRLLVASTFFLLLLTCCAAIATAVMIRHERADKEVAMHRAQLHLQEAQQVVDRFGLLLAEQLKDVPPLAELRQQVLQETEQFHRDFVDYAIDQPNLKNELGKAQFQWAVVLEQQGRFPQAIDVYEAAKITLRSAGKESSDSSLQKLRLSLVHNNLGSLLGRSGDTKRGEDELRLAITLQQQLLTEPTTGPRLLLDLANTEVNLGMLLGRTGQVHEAHQILQLAEGLLNRHLECQPEDQEGIALRAVCRNNAAALLLGNHSPAAEIRFRAALLDQRMLLELNPLSVARRSDLALTLNNLAAALTGQSELAAAQECYTEAVEILDSLLHSNPGDRQTQFELATAHNNLGQLALRQDRLAEADRELSAAEPLVRELLTLQPKDPRTRSCLGGVLHHCALLAESLGKADVAKDLLTEAVEHQTMAVEYSPEETNYQYYLSEHRANLTRLRGAL